MTDNLRAEIEALAKFCDDRTHAPHVVTTANLGREVLHHIEIVSSDGLPMPRLVCTAAPGADCRRRPEDDSVEEWGPGYDGPMIDSECWAIDWVNADTFEDQVTLTDRAGYVLDNGIVLARIPVEVKYDEGVTAQVLTPPPAPTKRKMCPSCGALDGAHGLVHERFPQGGGGTNKPCPLTPAPAPIDREALKPAVSLAIESAYYGDPGTGSQWDLMADAALDAIEGVRRG